MAAAVPLASALRLAAAAGRGLLTANLVLRTAQGALPLLGLLAMQRLLDAVARGTGADPATGPDASSVLGAVALAAGVAAVGAVLAAFATLVGERHARCCADLCASRLQRHAAALDLEQLETPAVRDLLHQAAGDASVRPARIVQDLAALCVAATTLVLMTLTTAIAAPWLPVLVGLAAVPQVLARHGHSRRQLAWSEANTPAQRQLGHLMGLLVGRPFAKDLRLLDLAEPLADRIDRERARLTADQLRLLRQRTALDTAAQLLGTAALFAAYLQLAYAALRGELSLGGLLLQAQAVQRTQNGVRDCLLAHAALRDDQRFTARLFAFLRLSPRQPPPIAAQPLPPGPLAVAVRGVHYTYPGSDRPALAGLDLELAAGERVALVGGNGAGKSTLVRLLCGLAVPQQGLVLAGGVPLAAVPAPVLHARVAVFFQDAAGLELTLRDNLAFDAAAAGDADLRARAVDAGLGELLSSLPADFGTRLGRTYADGTELSAGQWRRLLLLRTLLRPADLLLLDEPFAFLDAAAQAAVAAHLADTRRARTILWIDHRVPPAAHLDRIVRLDRGRVVDAAGG